MRPEQIEQARQMREVHGLPYRVIADRFGVAMKTIQYQIDPRQREKAIESARSRRLAKRTVRGDDEPVLQIPEETRREWFDRAKAYASRTDTTAIICGDPLPGWSALERR